MRLAFKEWAVIVDALGRGQQILILRKGGIHEGRGGFQADQGEFLLFPTGFHQQRAAVIPAAQARLDQLAPDFRPDQVRIDYFCRVAEATFISAWSQIESLAGHHLWNQQVLRERFAWGRKEGLFALAVRVFALAAPQVLPACPEYGGCKSWVTLSEEISTALAQPVLSEAAFQEKVAAFRSALDSPQPAPLTSSLES